MSNFKSLSRGRRAMTSNRLWIIGALAVMLGCTGENPVAPAPPAQASAESASGRNYSFSINSADRTIQVKFARVRADGSESVSAFVRRMFASADSARATRLVIDLSATKGGDAFLAVPLVRGVLARERFARAGGLVVIVGPETFSPAQSSATLLRRYANPKFVGGL